MIDNVSTRCAVTELLNMLEIDICSEVGVEHINSGQHQLCAIAKTFFHQLLVLIMNELTAMLTGAERQFLFDINETQKTSGPASVTLPIAGRKYSRFRIGRRCCAIPKGSSCGISLRTALLRRT
jgi:ABC-type sugar transport system ATPase subunit